jgi:hypothetical protein
MIDKETKRLLEMASYSPEAQIDFLDFLFSLPLDEQINLVKSLANDYSGEYIVNVLIPAIKSKHSIDLLQTLVDTLGITKSPRAVPPLIDLIEHSGSDQIRKSANKSLNLLKLSGVDLDKAKYSSEGLEICENSQVYACYATIIDGIGNQGIIFSRITENDDILVFSVVLNDIEGVVDCFGFNGISKIDLTKIIDRFYKNSPIISVAPEYCKYMLNKAEVLNKVNNSSIPYEYIAWKSLVYDVDPLDEPVEEAALKFGKSVKIDNLAKSKELYDYEDFKHWFLDEDDHPLIGKFIDKIINNILENKGEYLKDSDRLISWLENEINEVIPEVFDKRWREIYRNRLLNVAYLFNVQGLSEYRDIASLMALELGFDRDVLSENNIFIKSFFMELLKKTVKEAFLRYQNKLDQQNNTNKNSLWNVRKIRQQLEPQAINIENVKDQNINDIIDILYYNWN